MTTPVEEVLQHYQLPFTLRRDQEEDINTLCDPDWARGGVYLPVGAGKTATTTMVAFHAGLRGLVDQIIVLCPPILLRQWVTWLESFNGVAVLLYRGAPAQRKGMSFDGADCVVTTPGLFKNDFARFTEFFSKRKTFLIVDEATCVRQVGTLMHKAVRDFMNTGQKMLLLLTGTTISAPFQSYGYIKLIAPSIYRDYSQFTMIHITRLDQYKTPCAYQNLDLLAKNMAFHTVRREARDIMDLPEITYVPVLYDLDPAHMRLYTKVVEELLVTLDDGLILDGLTPQRMRMTAQRVILMPAEFGGEKIRPAGFQLIDDFTTELGGDKLLIYSNFRSSNEAVFGYCAAAGLNPALIYGGNSVKQSFESLEKFKNDPTCLVLVGNPLSMGVGVDGLQHVCRAALFLELPTPAEFKQAVGRLERQGQKSRCVVKIGTANNTVQISLAKNSMAKESLVQRVVPTKDTMRRALMGK